MERIQLTDTTMDIAMKMSDGNPGAFNAIMGLIKSGGAIDPDDAMGGVGVLLSLDTLGIYGTDIYVLWSDICQCNTVALCAVLRASQLGFIKGSVITDASSRQDYSGRKMIDVSDCYSKVKERLPEFDSGGDFSHKVS
jgi:hypothetical protein